MLNAKAVCGHAVHRFTVCPKADAIYPIVSAASIVAKVRYWAEWTWCNFWHNTHQTVWHALQHLAMRPAGHARQTIERSSV